MLLVSLWQGFAERNRLPHYPVLAVQLLILLAWLVSSVQILNAVEQAISRRWPR